MSPDSGLGLALGLAKAAPAARVASSARVACFHCGEPCPENPFTKESKPFCCHGCLIVHDLLTEAGLGQFYSLSQHPGVRMQRQAAADRWAYLDEPSVRQGLLDFTDGKTCRVTFHVPAIHCVACVWLLENLFRLHPGIGKSHVNFPRREVAITFIEGKISLGQLAALLASIGYEPRLTLGELERKPIDPARKRLWLQTGVAGFAFGNIMLLSIPTYLGLDSFSQPLFGALFGYISLALALPVVLYSASDYWRSAWVSVRQRVLSLDVPIALGLGALYLQSAGEILSGHGEGYLDSLAGLVFFLLCGRAFQHKTFDRLAFDLDYKRFFPLSVVRKTAEGESSVALSELRIGDRLLLRNSELLPADCRLINGDALIDYSFVTGESEPVKRAAGEYLYAGGKQTGGVIEVETVKAVSQGYLASLWAHEAFRKQRHDRLNTLTNRYSRQFTRLVIAVALGSALFWVASGDSARGLKAFASVLIVACPCALALAAPFTLGTAQRLLARRGVFLKSSLVLERLAEVDTIVFDKTGTLTSANTAPAEFQPASGPLSEVDRDAIRSLVRHSTHPHSLRIAAALPQAAERPVINFIEVPGCGVEGNVAGRHVEVGSRKWLEDRGRSLPAIASTANGSCSYVAVDGTVLGAFVMRNAVRPNTPEMLRALAERCQLALLSGDNERDRQVFQDLFGPKARLAFNQTPLDKLGFIRQLQDSGRIVLMMGDGLNDAGALKQSDVGVAVVEKVGAFSPASDVILEAGRVAELSRILAFGQRSARIVRLSFAISALYNVIGVSIAAAGVLSPVICAVLMPLSSISVVLFACGSANWAAGKIFKGAATPGRDAPSPLRQSFEPQPSTAAA